MKKVTTRSIFLPAKKIVLSLSLLLTVAIASAAPPDPDPNEEVKTAFKKEFPGAQILSWSDVGELVKATFLFAGYRSEAYFSPEGELQGSIRNIFFSQVPLAVSKSVADRYTNAEVLEVSEITNGNGTRYLLRMETKTRKYKVQMDAGGNILHTERQKK
jgi:hypothetical protein